MNEGNRKNLTRYLILVIVLMVGLIVLSWVYGTGRLEINLENTSGDPVEVVLINQDNGNKITQQVQSFPISLTLKKGNYDVLVSVKYESFFAIANVSGWLKQNSITGSLNPEFGRQYIARDLASCVINTKTYLVSYACSGPAKDMRLHTPGTDTMPPLVHRDNTYIFEGEIEGVLNSPDGYLVLISSPPMEGMSAKHALYKITANQKEIINRNIVRELTDLDSSIKYNAKNYGNGFIVYDDSFKNVFYSSSFKTDLQLTKITAFEVNDTDLPLVDVVVDGRNILNVYSSVYDTSLKKHTSEVVLGDLESSMRFKFNKAFTSAQVCGDNLLCLEGMDGVEVYKILSKDKAEYSYRISGARYIFDSKNSYILVMDDRLVEFDPNSKQGFTLYSFGGHTLNTINGYEDGIIVGLTDKNGSVSGVYLSSSLKNDYIDRKINDLKNNNQIKAVTVHKDHIYISPNVGDPYLDQKSGQVIYSPTRRASVTKALPGILSELGIDSSKYKVINLLP